MDFPEHLRYHSAHGWVRLAGNEATIGISDYAQDELGDIVFIQLPQPGHTIEAGRRFGEVESVKTVSDLIAPVSGEVLERNERLQETPELVNISPYGDGWLLVVRLTQPAELDDLLTAEEYETKL